MDRLPLLIMAAALVSAVACRPSAPLNVSTIQIGKSLSSDNRVGTITAVFKPDDTIYVAILTDATGSGTIGVKWMYAGQVVGEPSKDVSYTGAAATEFHIQNSGGFPPGSYSVEGFLDGTSVGRRNFTVEK